MHIVLGSSSPRRKALLQSIFNNFIIIHPTIDEFPLKDESPLEFVKRTSIDKLQNIKQRLIYNPALIITCDTIVTINNEILGKPTNYQNAYCMLSKLSGRTHQVISSISLLYINDNVKEQLNDHEITNVTFKDLSENDITNYLSLIEYKDKAGAYAAQEYGQLIIEKIEGSLTNVIGFPLRCFYRMLSNMNLLLKVF